MYLTNLMPLAMPPTRPSSRVARPQLADRDEMSARNGQSAQNEHLPIERAKQADPPPTNAKATAARILEAGQRRRAEIPDHGPELTHPVAKAIVAAAAKARGPEPPAPLPNHPVARAIFFVGQKARGTLGAAGARELADFLRATEIRERLR
jgi:hypothetical protein